MAPRIPSLIRLAVRLRLLGLHDRSNPTTDRKPSISDIMIAGKSFGFYPLARVERHAVGGRGSMLVVGREPSAAGQQPV